MSETQDHNSIAGGAVSLLNEPAFLKELEEAAQSAGKDPQKALGYAKKCLHEIEATPRDSWLSPAARMARFIYTRSYEAELDINREALDQLREASRDQLLLFLWSHKSHMDSFVFLLSLYDNGFKPLPLVFAGVNMNFLGFGALARRVGAIFLRRSFQDDPIYKLVFRHYIDYLIRNRLPLTWSIEGTRSRTGKLSPPKLGILNWVLEACERENMRDVQLVPVSIAFDRIAEIDDYVALQQGLPKRKESLRWFLNYIFGMKEPYGKIYVRYAQPIALKDAPALGSDPDSGEGPSLATQLAFEVCTRIEQITPIKSADVLTMVLLAANGRAMSDEEVYLQAKEIVEVVEQRELPVASGFSLRNEQQVNAAVLSMHSSGLIKSFDKGSTTVFYIPEEQQLAAAYYRNTITHFFLAAAIGETALSLMLDSIDQPSADQLRLRVESLRDLFKFEFFFKPREEAWQDVQDETRRRYPQWDEGSSSLQKQLHQRPPQFGHAILRSIAEAYQVVASTLLALGEVGITDQRKFTNQLLDQGREMLLRRRISGESAISKDLFTTGLRLAEHRQLLQGEGEGLQSRRERFANETAEVLAAINHLQKAYDDIWFP
jgi:glycerol-3-phosphate O-acyltransferase